MADRFASLGAAMRAHGIRIGPSEVTDAARVAAALGFDHRTRLRSGLAAAMVRQAEDRGTFDQLFDLFFPPAVGDRATAADADETGLLDQVPDALATGHGPDLERLAAVAVRLLGMVDPGHPERGWSAARTLNALETQQAAAVARPRPRPEQLSDRVAGEEVRRRVDRFRERVTSEARRRNAELYDRDRLARLTVPSSLRRRDFISSSEPELAELGREIDPLARRLASRLTARERSGRGSIDVRRTLRASMSTGGVPIKPAYRRRSPHRPDLVLLADLSGSVGGFSTFTMLLMQALRQHFRRVRVFGFVSSTAEITDLVRALPAGASLTGWALGSPALTARGTGSSYGWALRTFARDHLDAVTGRTTVLILGDARNNFGAPNVADLVRIRDRARHVRWLNPEPTLHWQQGDSEIRRYGDVVPVHECRNLEQLRHFVADVLPT